MSTKRKPIDVKSYVKKKIKMLRRDFHIPLGEKEINHFSTLTSEISVDRYARQLILAKLSGTVF